MKLVKFLLLFLTATLVLSSCGGSKKASHKKPKVRDELSRYPLNFIRSKYLSDVLEQAKREKKLVFVDMYADWCAPCKVMDEELYMNEDFADIINEHYISFKVNVEKGNGPNLNGIFSVEVLPTLLFLDAEGNVLQRNDGALGYSHFINMASTAVEMVR